MTTSFGHLKKQHQAVTLKNKKPIILCNNTIYSLRWGASMAFQQAETCSRI